MSKRDEGARECSDNFLGYHAAVTSTGVMWVADMPEYRTRRLLSQDELDHKELNSTTYIMVIGSKHGTQIDLILWKIKVCTTFLETMKGQQKFLK